MPQDHRIWQHPDFDFARGPVVRFTFDGRPVLGYEGETVGAALLATGLRTLARSIKFHRPRGIRCAIGKCAQCFVTADGIPNVRACTEPVRGGMAVRSQNAWPSVAHDALRIFDYGSFLLKPGFQYRLFIRPRWLRPRFYRMLRALAGHGRVTAGGQTTPPAPRREVERVPLVVVGGGPAGMAAALAAASAGIAVTLVDENTYLGGHLLFDPTLVREGPPEYEGRPGPAVAAALTTQVAATARINVLDNTVVIGGEAGILPVVGPEGLRKLQPDALIIATGAYDAIPPFPGSDLPNVFGRRAMQRVLHEWGVRPAPAAALLEDDDALRAQLRAAGMAVTESGLRPPTRGCAVVSPWLRPNNDLCAVIGCRMRFSAEPGGMVPELTDAMESSAERVFVCGEAAGVVGAGTAILQGGLAGLSAALALGAGDAATRRAREALLPHGQARNQVPTSTLPNPHPGAPRGGVVCLCEDVSDGDLRHCIAGGYADSESLKRFSGIGMGPCQGKYCAGRMLEMLVEAGVTDPHKTRPTTQRPPLAPTRLADLAGETDEVAHEHAR